MDDRLIYEVLSVVEEIPEGRVATYGQIARLAGMPRCARLVGYAMAACQDPAVPCHRVVAADGRLTGYAGGLDRKVWLLRHEGLAITPDGTSLCR